jgi:hypothetical protein
MTLLETLGLKRPAPKPQTDGYEFDRSMKAYGRDVYGDLGFLPRGVVAWVPEREFLALRYYLGPKNLPDVDSFGLWGGRITVQLRLDFSDIEINACLAVLS